MVHYAICCEILGLSVYLFRILFKRCDLKPLGNGRKVGLVINLDGGAGFNDVLRNFEADARAIYKTSL